VLLGRGHRLVRIKSRCEAEKNLRRGLTSSDYCSAPARPGKNELRVKHDLLNRYFSSTSPSGFLGDAIPNCPVLPDGGILS
jgi:hypothetical protein